MNQHLAIALSPQRVPLTVADVVLLTERATFESYGKVELIEGELLYVNAQYRPHMVAKSELAYRLRRALDDAQIGLFVGTEGSVAFSEHDLPQPAVLLTSEPGGDGPVPGDSIALLVEVADTTLAHDLGRTARVYTTQFVPEYWIVNLNDRIIHQLWSPCEDRYEQSAEHAFDTTMTAQTIPGLCVATTSL